MGDYWVFSISKCVFYYIKELSTVHKQITWDLEYASRRELFCWLFLFFFAYKTEIKVNKFPRTPMIKVIIPHTPASMLIPSKFSTLFCSSLFYTMVQKLLRYDKYFEFNSKITDPPIWGGRRLSCNFGKNPRGVYCN